MLESSWEYRCTADGSRAVSAWAGLRRLLAATLACMLVACGQAVPQDKVLYIGVWRAPNMSLAIRADGRVLYQRRDGLQNTRIDAPLQSFHGDSFDVGVGPLKTTFVVTVAPHEDAGQWKMTVDGVELTRAAVN